MSIKELTERVEREGIISISGGIFVETDKLKPNTTVEQYCINRGKFHDVTGDEYAATIIRMLDAPDEEDYNIDCPTPNQEPSPRAKQIICDALAGKV